MKTLHTYTVRKLRQIAENYHEYVRLAYDGCRWYENGIDEQSWDRIIEMLVDFDTALAALGLTKRFYQVLKEPTYHLGGLNYWAMAKYLNGDRSVAINKPQDGRRATYSGD